MNIKEIIVGYWSTKGLGSVCRQMVIYAGIPLKAKNYKLQAILNNDVISYDGKSWTDNDKMDLKKRNSLINLPYIELVNSNDHKILISQSNACLMFLGRKLNMFGNNEIELSHCEQLLFETHDLRNLITSFAYTHFENNDKEYSAAKDVFNKAFENTNSGKMQKFENWINNNKHQDSYFLVNNHISAPDFNLFDILDFYIEFLKHYNFTKEQDDRIILNELGYPNLSNFYSHFKELPKMNKYFNSLLYKLPYTNKSANFGSGIKGKTWDSNNQVDNTPLELMIN